MERLTALQYFSPKQKRWSHDSERENNAKIYPTHAFIRHSYFSLRVAITAAMAGISGITVSSIAVASSPTMTQDELRAIAPGPLQSVDVPRIPNLHEFVRDQRLGILLGKALFWDQAVGSDEVTACASCHFKAGADNRSKNQLSPGLLDRTPGVNPAMFDQLDGGKGGPNYQLTIDDFPFSKDINDVVSSQGVYKRLFNGLISDSRQPAVQTPYASGQWQEDCTSDALPPKWFSMTTVRSKALPPVIWGLTPTANRKTPTSRAWNCMVSTHCSVKAAAATSASS